MVLTEFNRKSLQTIDYIALNITIYVYIEQMLIYMNIATCTLWSSKIYIPVYQVHCDAIYRMLCILYAKIVIVNFRQQLLEFLPIIITITMTIGVIVGVLLLLLLFQPSNTGLRCLAETAETQQPFVWLAGDLVLVIIFSAVTYVVMLLMR